MSYNPFNKPAGTQLDDADLRSLVGRVAEGYFVEFKESLPSSRKIARGIASLANTAGGWYIVGVKTDDRNVASEICGVPPERSGDPLATVRDVAKSRIDPMPLIFPSLVETSAGRVVIVTYVPGRQRTPFVTDDGRVYRRAHDSSDPIPEDRRHALDRLVDRGRAMDRVFARFCAQEREPGPVGDDGIGWVNLYLMPEPLGLVHRPALITKAGVEELRDLASKNRPLFGGGDEDGFSVAGSLPFGHVQVLHRGVRLRQLQQGQLTLPGLVMEIFMGGSARFHIPVALTSPLKFVGTDMLSEESEEFLLDLYARGDRPSEDALGLRFFDIGRMLLQVTLLLRLHAEWLGTVEWWPDFRIGFSFRGFWSGVPFVDTEEWRTLVVDWGMPMVSEDIQVPEDWSDPIMVPSNGPEDFIDWDVIPAMAGALGLESAVMGAGLGRAMEVAASQMGQHGSGG